MADFRDAPIPMVLVRPARVHLASYVAALERGWSPDNIRGLAATADELAAIAKDADAFLAAMDARSPGDAMFTLPDGSKAPRLPGYRRWMWDGEFCGTIGFRWQPGRSDLPPHVLGHIGYAVVPWKQRSGHAKRALGLILADAKAEGLEHVELTADPDNIASHRVIEAHGGTLVGAFVRPAAYGGTPAVRFRIRL